MGSDELPEGYRADYTDADVPQIALRLAKIPPGWELLGDKGFEKTDRFFPFMNAVRTPLVLRSRDTKQYRTVELAGEDGKKSLCTLRYTSEVGFSRVTILDGLKDVIPYRNLSILQHMHHWGHAMINLKMPLRRPGRNSVVGRDYWGD